MWVRDIPTKSTYFARDLFNFFEILPGKERSAVSFKVASEPAWSSAGLSENDHPVGIRALAVVRHAPAVCRLREVLRVDQNQHGFESRRHTCRDHDLFELQGTPPDLTDFERDVSPGPQRASQFGQGAPDERL